jgi:hypothetical protein
MKNLTCSCGAVFVACRSADLRAEVEAHLAEAHPRSIPPSSINDGPSISDDSLETEVAT